jgi:prefoldin subunit 1
VQEIDSRAALAQRDLGIVKSHIAAKQRDLRLLQLTSSELVQLPKETNVYEGVGKMYYILPLVGSVQRSVRKIPDVAIHRFVLSPTADVESRLSSEAGELKSDINKLEKRLHYLETTHKNSRDNIDQILKSGGRA